MFNSLDDFITENHFWVVETIDSRGKVWLQWGQLNFLSKKQISSKQLTIR